MSAKHKITPKQRKALVAVVMQNMPQELMPVFAALAAAGGEPFVNGGFVRDAMFEVAHNTPMVPKDIDTEVFGLEFDEIVAVIKQFGKVVMNDVGERFKVAKLHIEGSSFDFFDFNSPRVEVPDESAGEGRGAFKLKFGKISKKKACSRRDFTINAALVNPITLKFVDPFNGFSDVVNRILRPTGPSFADDALRGLRAMQFCSRMNLTLAQDDPRIFVWLQEALAKFPAQIGDDKNRVREEFVKWAKGRWPGMGLKFLFDSGWSVLFPETHAFKDIPQSPIHHPEGKVGNHVIETLNVAGEIAERDNLSLDERLEFFMTMWNHDNGKVTHTQIDVATGKITAHGHDEAGIEPARAFMASIFETQSLIDAVAIGTKWHMAHIDFDKRRKSRQRKLVADIAQEMPIRKLMRIIQADVSGRPWTGVIKMPVSAQMMWEVAQERHIEDKPLERIFKGEDLKAMGIKPGPDFGIIMDVVFEAQMRDQVNSIEDAQVMAMWVREVVADAPAGSKTERMQWVLNSTIGMTTEEEAE